MSTMKIKISGRVWEDYKISEEIPGASGREEKKKAILIYTRVYLKYAVLLNNACYQKTETKTY